MTGYAADGPILWPYLPDWSQPVNESLAWLTDVMQAATGGQQARALRDAPRRGFSFRSVVRGDARRIADAVRFDIGIRRFMLPIWPDVQWPSTPIAAGATLIPCRTAGFDFVEGGQVALYSDVNAWEVATIASIAADSLTLTAGTVGAYGIGSRLYPLRKARLAQPPRASYVNDGAAVLDVQATIDEPCDWTAGWPTATTYRSQPVLEWRNEESENPTVEYDRLSGAIDQDVGPVYYFDLPGMPFRVQSQRFQLLGRDDHSRFRALVYQLGGRAGQVWVPSWLSDVRVAQSIGASDVQIHVPWMGYSLFGYLQANRRDLAIELNDGTVFYRRITGSAVSGDTEVLQIDSALSQAVDPSAIRQLGWLSLCTSAADTVTIEHDTDADGLAVAKLNWQAIKSDV